MVKILAIGDPHGKLPKGFDSIVKKNQIEVIVSLGELFPINRDKKSHNGVADFKAGERTLDKLCSYKIPVIIFKGNMFFKRKSLDYFRSLINRCNRKYNNLYYKKLGKISIGKIDFISFDIIYEKHSHEHLSSYWTDEEKNKKRFLKLNKLLKENRNAILLSHAPPYGVLDKIHSGKHIGSKFLLRAIKEQKPGLVLCGHVHESKGKAKIEKTEVYNLGCCGDYKIFDLK